MILTHLSSEPQSLKACQVTTSIRLRALGRVFHLYSSHLCCCIQGILRGRIQTECWVKQHSPSSHWDEHCDKDRQISQPNCSRNIKLVVVLSRRSRDVSKIDRCPRSETFFSKTPLKPSLDKHPRMDGQAAVDYCKYVKSC